MRNLCFSFFVLMLFSGSLRSQNLSGQWTGGFVSSSGLLGGETEYVLELDIHKESVEGFSYTYFYIGGKRHYVICKLAGVYDEGSKSISVTEVAKVKSNTPPDFRDCLQTHILTFFKQGDREVLKGRWKSASETDRCGTGATELERKALVKITPVQPPAKDKDTAETLAKTPKPKTDSPAATKKTTTGSTAKKVAPATGTTAKKTNPTTGTATKKPAATKPGTGTTAKKTAPSKTSPVTTTAKSATEKSKNDSLKTVQSPSISEKHKNPEQVSVNKEKIPTMNASKFGARNKKVISTIEVPEAEFTVHLYDNGQIDGDTVTLYFNGRVIVSKQRLSTAPISLKIKLDSGTNENDLVMIAENLGSIPPNTALMVVTVGDKRYEVNITSTEQVNGTVRFKLKE